MSISIRFNDMPEFSSHPHTLNLFYLNEEPTGHESMHHPELTSFLDNCIALKKPAKPTPYIIDFMNQKADLAAQKYLHTMNSPAYEETHFALPSGKKAVLRVIAYSRQLL